MCTKNGKAGLIGEHSMMDGMPMIDFADYLTKQAYNRVKSKSLESTITGSTSIGVENIFSKCVDNMVHGDSKVKSLVKKGKN